MGAILGVWHPGDRIYHGWFTEWFDTRDLKEAKALLTKPIDFGMLRSEIDMRIERAA